MNWFIAIYSLSIDGTVQRYTKIKMLMYGMRLRKIIVLPFPASAARQHTLLKKGYATRAKYTHMKSKKAPPNLNGSPPTINT